MNIQAVIGLDIGTRSTKALLVSLAGKVLAQHTIDHSVDMPAPGHQEHDADLVWWSDTCNCLVALAAAAPLGTDIIAVGLSSCGPCFVPVDAAGSPLRAGILYGVDTRAVEQVEGLERIWPSDLAIAEFGMPFSSQSVYPKLQWLRDHEPEIADATATVLTTTGYVAFRLTGARVIDHHQASYIAPLYRDGGWDDSSTDPWRAALPELRWSDEIVGTITCAAAIATGLAEGTPVVLGSSDGVTDAIGAGATKSGSAVLRYGSTLGITAIVENAVGGTGVWTTPGHRSGSTMIVAGLSTGGAVTTWFREQFGLDLAQSTNEDIFDAHGALTTEAEHSPLGAGGLLLLPYFAGERTPFFDPGARGAILGLGLHTTRGDLYRAILEGTAFGVRAMIEAIRVAGGEIQVLRAVGGGTARSLWMQIVSDATRLPQERAEPHFGAPFGAARLAAESAGLIGVDAAPWTSVAESITPDDAAAAFYEARYSLFLRLYRQTRDILRDLAEQAPESEPSL